MLQCLPFLSNYSTKHNNRPEDDIEEDELEVEERRRRDSSDPDDVESYDANFKTTHYESKGSYSLRLVAQRRVVRRRSTTKINFEHLVEDSLLGFINES